MVGLGCGIDSIDATHLSEASIGSHLQQDSLSQGSILLTHLCCAVQQRDGFNYFYYFAAMGTCGRFHQEREDIVKVSNAVTNDCQVTLCCVHYLAAEMSACASLPYGGS
jgi:hypothetical protein